MLEKEDEREGGKGRGGGGGELGCALSAYIDARQIHRCWPRCRVTNVQVTVLHEGMMRRLNLQHLSGGCVCARE